MGEWKTYAWGGVLLRSLAIDLFLYLYAFRYICDFYLHLALFAALKVKVNGALPNLDPLELQVADAFRKHGTDNLKTAAESIRYEPEHNL